MATCPQCGSNNAETSASCWKCYASLRGDAPSTTAPTAPPRKPISIPRPTVNVRGVAKKSVMPLVIALAMVLVMGGAGAYYALVMQPKSQAQYVAVEFVKAQSAWNFPRMKELTTSGSGQAISALERLIDTFPQSAQLKNLIKLDKVEAGAVTMSGGEAQVAMSVTVSGISTSPNLALARENGVWKVDLVKTQQSNQGLNQEMMRAMLKQGGSGFVLPGFGGAGKQ